MRSDALSSAAAGRANERRVAVNTVDVAPIRGKMDECSIILVARPERANALSVCRTRYLFHVQPGTSQEPPAGQQNDEHAETEQPERVRSCDEHDGERARRHVDDAFASDGYPRGESLHRHPERHEQQDARRTEVRPRLPDEPGRGIPGDGLRRIDHLRVDPVPEVRDVVPADERAGPSEPGQAQEVGLFGGDRRLERGERAWLDEEEAADGPLSGDRSRVGREALGRAKDADGDERDGTNDRPSRDRTGRDRSPGQQPRKNEACSELCDEVSAREGDHGRDKDADDRDGRSWPAERRAATDRLEEKDGRERRDGDANELDRQAGERDARTRRVSRQQWQPRRDDDRQDRSDGDGREDRGDPAAWAGFRARQDGRIRWQGLGGDGADPSRKANARRRRDDTRAEVEAWPGFCIADRDRKRPHAEEDRLEGEPCDGRMEEPEPATARDRGDERDCDAEPRDDGDGGRDRPCRHRGGSPVATPARPLRAASAAPPTPPAGSRADNQAYDATPSSAVGSVLTSRYVTVTAAAVGGSSPSAPRSPTSARAAT